jgi:YjbE family integral membrane protein
LGSIDLSADFASPQFWWSVFWIFIINGLLSGDNAVLIALACRGLPRRERLWGLVIGAGVAAVLLIAFTAIVSSLMQWPYLRFVSGLLLFWIAIRLARPAAHDAEGSPEAVQDLWRAVRIVVVADIVMSLDNVVALAAIANGQYVLLGLGLMVSIPIVIGGSALVLALIERFPIVVWLGAAVLGWVAGGLLATDPMVQAYLGSLAQVSLGIDSHAFGDARQFHLQFGLDIFKIALGFIGAIVVILGGLIWRAAGRVYPTCASNICRSGAGPRSVSPAGADETGSANTGAANKEHRPAE